MVTELEVPIIRNGFLHHNPGIRDRRPRNGATHRGGGYHRHSCHHCCSQNQLCIAACHDRLHHERDCRSLCPNDAVARDVLHICGRCDHRVMRKPRKAEFRLRANVTGRLIAGTTSALAILFFVKKAAGVCDGGHIPRQPCENRLTQPRLPDPPHPSRGTEPRHAPQHAPPRRVSALRNRAQYPGIVQALWSLAV
jgi:hypothetical protein